MYLVELYVDVFVRRDPFFPERVHRRRTLKDAHAPDERRTPLGRLSGSLRSVRVLAHARDEAGETTHAGDKA